MGNKYNTFNKWWNFKRSSIILIKGDLYSCSVVISCNRTLETAFAMDVLEETGEMYFWKLWLSKPEITEYNYFLAKISNQDHIKSYFVLKFIQNSNKNCTQEKV